MLYREELKKIIGKACDWIRTQGKDPEEWVYVHALILEQQKLIEFLAQSRQNYGAPKHIIERKIAYPSGKWCGGLGLFPHCHVSIMPFTVDIL